MKIYFVYVYMKNKHFLRNEVIAKEVTRLTWEFVVLGSNPCVVVFIIIIHCINIFIIMRYLKKGDSITNLCRWIYRKGLSRPIYLLLDDLALYDLLFTLGMFTLGLCCTLELFVLSCFMTLDQSDCLFISVLSIYIFALILSTALLTISLKLFFLR